MKSMWDNRNEVLHGNGNAIHQHEMTAINQEIIAEWQVNLDLLPAERYQHLFTRTVQRRLEDTVHQKQQWLCGVWVAREKHGTTNPRERNTSAVDFYSRWKEKLIFQREIKALDAIIITEWNRELDQLPANQFTHLFDGNLQIKLGQTLPQKKCWVCMVWRARDDQNGEMEGGRDTSILSIYLRWRQRAEET